MWIMKNKLKLVLWGKGLELPMDYDKLDFDDYKFYDETKEKYMHLHIYKKRKIIKKNGWHKNGKLRYEYNCKNGEYDGKQYWWHKNGKFRYERNYKDGNYDGKQYYWWSGGELAYELNYKNGEKDGKQYMFHEDGKKIL